MQILLLLLLLQQTHIYSNSSSYNLMVCRVMQLIEWAKIDIVKSDEMPLPMPMLL